MTTHEYRIHSLHFLRHRFLNDLKGGRGNSEKFGMMCVCVCVCVCVCACVRARVYASEKDKCLVSDELQLSKVEHSQQQTDTILKWIERREEKEERERERERERE